MTACCTKDNSNGPLIIAEQFRGGGHDDLPLAVHSTLPTAHLTQPTSLRRQTLLVTMRLLHQIPKIRPELRRPGGSGPPEHPGLLPLPRH